MYKYDENNVFHRILKKEIPADVIYENNIALSFYDIHPQKRVHALVITKGLYTNFADFVSRVDAQDLRDFFVAVAKVADVLGVSQTGYRILSNTGPDSGQEVEHFHVHILGGERL
ncbi:MAG: HIT domain-containing protein [Holosporaceae bacterium]|jgi:diadenosine tetraphosphate (Ap4A) HIT family hydrolase|nr:HIT domain-containing protein [Holosporaceae bacterium]